MEKVEWCRQHLPGTSLAITEDKGVIAGDVLAEDWPPYIARRQERSRAGW
jgi:5'-nucleotidase